MDKPLTQKQELFANHVAEGNTLSDAYRHAYSVENLTTEMIWVESSRTMAIPKVSLRVIELQEEARERTLVTIESLTKELDEDRVLARNEGQASAAISAVMSKAKLHGLVTDKKAVSVEANVSTVTVYELPDNGRDKGGAE